MIESILLIIIMIIVYNLTENQKTHFFWYIFFLCKYEKEKLGIFQVFFGKFTIYLLIINFMVQSINLHAYYKVYGTFD